MSSKKNLPTIRSSAAEYLARIREIRLSERKFYQKITDIYATAIDYDNSAQTTQRFFATVQNKLHWAIHGQTAAEVIYARANAEQTHMGLNTWQDAPNGKIQKFDVVVAKNYLSDGELAQLQRLVSAYLDLAETMAERNISTPNSEHALYRRARQHLLRNLPVHWAFRYQSGGRKCAVLSHLSADKAADPVAQTVARHHAQGLYLRSKTGLEPTMDRR